MDKSTLTFNITDKLYNKNKLIGLGISLPILVSIILKLDLSIGLYAFVSVMLSSHIGLTGYKPFFTNKLLKLSLSMPLNRNDYFKEFIKPYIYHILPLVVTTFICCILFSSFTNNILLGIGLYLGFNSYEFLKAMEPTASTAIETFIYFFNWVVYMLIFGGILFYIDYTFNTTSGYLYIIFSLISNSLIVYRTKVKFNNFSF